MKQNLTPKIAQMPLILPSSACLCLSPPLSCAKSNPACSPNPA